jgi:hypothetical protein
MISNSTAIAEVFSRLDHKFDLRVMYAKRALGVEHRSRPPTPLGHILVCVSRVRYCL